MRSRRNRKGRLTHPEPGVTIRTGSSAICSLTKRMPCPFVQLISMIRQGQAKRKSLEEAVKAAIDTCISQDILKDYLIKHKAEVTAMILTEYNEKLREKTLREEGLEQGLEQGRRTMANAIRKVMSDMNLSADQAMEFLGIAEEDRGQYRSLL